MKAIVYQSYRRENVPAWMQQCMDSVRDWARQSGHDYHFSGDEFLALAPDWYRRKAGQEICPVTDLSRLLLAREFLAGPYELAIWLDADVLVFRPDAMQLSLPQGFAFTHEMWTHLGAHAEPVITHKVNNSVMLFARNNVHLGFFIDACLQIAHHRTRLGKFDVGTDFLSRLRNILPFPLLESVGMLSPPLMADIVNGESRFLAHYGHALPQALACANLCASLQGQDIPHFSTDNSTYETVVSRLLETRGDIINRERKPEYARTTQQT